MRRRDFIALFSGAVTWPLVAQAQQVEGRRIGVLMNFPSEDTEGQRRIAAFLPALQKFGWTQGSNIRIDVRWVGDDVNLTRRCAEELVALAPDVLLASGSTTVAAFQRVTTSVPIIFANIADPVGAGFVRSLRRPGGNTTGFIAFEYNIGGKWLELLKRLAPQTTRVAVLRDPTVAASIGLFAVIQSAASSPGFELSVIDSRDANEIERELATFGREPNGAIITTATASAVTHRKLIIALLRRYRLPDIYAFRYYPADGGLASYGPDPVETYKRAAEYVDRVLKGAKPSELPVQAPTKYELVLNLRAAKAMGLEIPTSMLATADEVIE